MADNELDRAAHPDDHFAAGQEEQEDEDGWGRPVASQPLVTAGHGELKQDIAAEVLRKLGRLGWAGETPSLDDINRIITAAGPAVGGPMDRRAGYVADYIANGNSPPRMLGGATGFENEIGLRVRRSNGAALPIGQELGRSATGNIILKVDFWRDRETVLELVSAPMRVLSNERDRPDSKSVYAEARDIIQRLDMVQGQMSLAEALPGFFLTELGEKAQVFGTRDERRHLFQFTSGIPLGGLYHFLKNAVQPSHRSLRKMHNSSLGFGDQVAAHFAGIDSTRGDLARELDDRSDDENIVVLRGVAALVYAQVAAPVFWEHAGKGVLKTYAPVASRVDLADIRKEIPEAVRDYLESQADSVRGIFRSFISAAGVSPQRDPLDIALLGGQHTVGQYLDNFLFQSPEVVIGQRAALQMSMSYQMDRSNGLEQPLVLLELRDEPKFEDLSKAEARQAVLDSIQRLAYRRSLQLRGTALYGPVDTATNSGRKAVRPAGTGDDQASVNRDLDPEVSEPTSARSGDIANDLQPVRARDGAVGGPAAIGAGGAQGPGDVLPVIRPVRGPGLAGLVELNFPKDRGAAQPEHGEVLSNLVNDLIGRLGNGNRVRVVVEGGDSPSRLVGIPISSGRSYEIGAERARGIARQLQGLLKAEKISSDRVYINYYSRGDGPSALNERNNDLTDERRRAVRIWVEEENAAENEVRKAPDVPGGGDLDLRRVFPGTAKTDAPPWLRLGFPERQDTEQSGHVAKLDELADYLIQIVGTRQRYLRITVEGGGNGNWIGARGNSKETGLRRARIVANRLRRLLKEKGITDGQMAIEFKSRGNGKSGLFSQRKLTPQERRSVFISWAETRVQETRVQETRVEEPRVQETQVEETSRHIYLAERDQRRIDKWLGDVAAEARGRGTPPVGPVSAEAVSDDLVSDDLVPAFSVADNNHLEALAGEVIRDMQAELEEAPEVLPLDLIGRVTEKWPDVEQAVFRMLEYSEDPKDAISWNRITHVRDTWVDDNRFRYLLAVPAWVWKRLGGSPGPAGDEGRSVIRDGGSFSAEQVKNAEAEFAAGRFGMNDFRMDIDMVAMARWLAETAEQTADGEEERQYQIGRPYARITGYHIEGAPDGEASYLRTTSVHEAMIARVDTFLNRLRVPSSVATAESLLPVNQLAIMTLDSHFTGTGLDHKVSITAHLDVDARTASSPRATISRQALRSLFRTLELKELQTEIESKHREENESNDPVTAARVNAKIAAHVEELAGRLEEAFVQDLAAAPESSFALTTDVEDILTAQLIGSAAAKKLNRRVVLEIGRRNPTKVNLCPSRS